MYSKSDNVKTTRGVDANDTIQELISTFLQRYQEGLETKMKVIIYCSDYKNESGYKM